MNQMHYYWMLIVLSILAFHCMCSDEINDEFCDRQDGSDETRTSACSYLKVHFTCSNGVTIPTSRVNDGVCDCCDGGDELNTPKALQCIVSCPDASDKSLWFSKSKVYKGYPLPKPPVAEVASVPASKTKPQSIKVSFEPSVEIPSSKQNALKKIPSSSFNLNNGMTILVCLMLILGIFLYSLRTATSDSHGPILATYRRSGSTTASPLYCFGHTNAWITKVYFSLGRCLRLGFLNLRMVCTCCCPTGRNSWLDKSVAETV